MPVKPGKSERENLWRLLEMARREDLGPGDVTSSILPAEVSAVGKFVGRQPMVFCGGTLLEAIAVRYDGRLRTNPLVPEGEHAERGVVLAEWRGPARSMMAAERVALNFLQRLSTVATTTREYVEAIRGTGATIYDTRKTTPGWRELEKYAVRVGGGKNHRKGLYDAVLVKDNHLAVIARAEGEQAVGETIQRELERLRPYLPEGAFIELEVDTLEQFRTALRLPIDIILLDNMTTEEIAEAVRQRDQSGRKDLELEASGGIDLTNVRQVAETGVERIAVGALTHSAGAIDIGLDIEIC